MKEAFARHGRCIVAVSEGIHDEKGEAIITKLWGRRRRTRTATCSSPAPARSPISCARK